MANSFNQKPMSGRKLYYISILTLLLGFAGGFYFARSALFFPAQTPVVSVDKPVQPSPDVSMGETEDYQQGYSDALKYAEEKIASVYGADPLTRINGTIQSIEGSKITVEYQASSANALGQGSATKVFTLSGNTSIEKHIPKTEAEIMAVPGVSSSGISGSAVSLSYHVEKLQLSDLKAGDDVEVRTSNDIRTADDVVVTAVILSPSGNEAVIEEQLPPLTRINGTIQSIEGSNITVEYGGQQGSATKVFTLSGNTSIEKHIPKTQEEIMAAPAEEASSDSVGSSVFLSYHVEKLQLSDLKAGDDVEVRTSNNIRTADPVQVLEIIVRNDNAEASTNEIPVE